MEQNQIIETQKKIIDSLSQGVSDGIIIVDPNRIVTHFNRGAEIITGFSVVEVLNKKIDDFLKVSSSQGSIDLDNVIPITDLQIQGTIYEEKNIRLVQKSNEENIVNLRSEKIARGNELNIGGIIFIEDTFEQSDFERTKLDFVSMSEHVLRTPITVIKGYLTRLMQEETIAKLDEEERTKLNNAYHGTNELLILVQDLLNITGIRKNDLTIKVTAIDLQNLVAKIVSESKMMAEEKGLEISYIPPTEILPMVNADISKIRIVLQNLIENAIKYTQEGKVTIMLHNLGSELQVGVRDTGRGIEQDNIQYLFTKFYRVKKALEMDYGMGLGLYMCKKIIDAHGGKIWVESEVGKGSTFFFKLPIV